MLVKSAPNSKNVKVTTYVRWKALIVFGLIFWLLLCLTDDVRERKLEMDLLELPMEKFFDEERPIFRNAIGENELPLPPPPLLLEEEPLSIIRVILWNLVAFLSTFCACFTIKCISTKMTLGDGAKFFISQDMIVRKTSSSRIPIPVSSKSSATDIHIDSTIGETTHVELTNKSCPNLLTIQNVKEKNKKVWSIKVMEKHCLKLRDEMINLQTTSLKEHATIARRLDMLNREKRELTRQLAFTARENQSLKRQIDDMIDERNLLIRRLESATKELKANTKSKKATMARLDETIVNAEHFKTNLEQITRDKEILEDKLMILDVEYKRLKEELNLYKNKTQSKVKGSGKIDLQLGNKEHAIDVYEVSDDNRTVTSKEAGDMDEEKSKIKAVLTQTYDDADFDISRPEKDMIKVQQKLITLERSLENFKIRDSNVKMRQEKIDLYPVNESENFLDRNRIISTPSTGFYTKSIEPQRQTPVSCSSPSLPAPKSSHSSSQSMCSDELHQCPYERKDCPDPECRRHHWKKRRDPTTQTAIPVSIPPLALPLQSASVGSQQQGIFCAELKSALERREFNIAANNNNGTEYFLQRHSLSTGAVSSVTTPPSPQGSKGNEETASSSETSLCHVVGKEPLVMLCQKPIKYLKTTVSDDRLSAISEKATRMGDEDDDSADDDFEPKRKIFTNTPEFQKLLKEILDPLKPSCEDEAVRETDDSEYVY